jgi:hypothetical protein
MVRSNQIAPKSLSEPGRCEVVTRWLGMRQERESPCAEDPQDCGPEKRALPT